MSHCGNRKGNCKVLYNTETRKSGSWRLKNKLGMIDTLYKLLHYAEWVRNRLMADGKNRSLDKEKLLLFWIFVSQQTRDFVSVFSVQWTEPQSLFTFGYPARREPPSARISPLNLFLHTTPPSLSNPHSLTTKLSPIPPSKTRISPFTSSPEIQRHC